MQCSELQHSKGGCTCRKCPCDVLHKMDSEGKPHSKGCQLPQQCWDLPMHGQVTLRRQVQAAVNELSSSPLLPQCVVGPSWTPGATKFGQKSDHPLADGLHTLAQQGNVHEGTAVCSETVTQQDWIFPLGKHGERDRAIAARVPGPFINGCICAGHEVAGPRLCKDSGPCSK
jgi:hypothetical protein